MNSIVRETYAFGNATVARIQSKLFLRSGCLPPAKTIRRRKFSVLSEDRLAQKILTRSHSFA